jgi:hypothetical protein
MIQAWLRDGSRRPGYWESGANNFKQCCGLCTDLVVDLVHKFSGNISGGGFSPEVLVVDLVHKFSGNISASHPYIQLLYQTDRILTFR